MHAAHGELAAFAVNGTAVVAECIQRRLKIADSRTLEHGLGDGEYDLFIIAVLIVDELTGHESAMRPRSFAELCHDHAVAEPSGFDDEGFTSEKTADPADMAHSSVGVAVENRFAEPVAALYIVDAAFFGAPCAVTVIGIHIGAEIIIEQTLAVTDLDMLCCPICGCDIVARAIPTLVLIEAVKSPIKKLLSYNDSGRNKQIFLGLGAAFFNIERKLRTERDAFALCMREREADKINGVFHPYSPFIKLYCDFSDRRNRRAPR